MSWVIGMEGTKLTTNVARNYHSAQALKHIMRNGSLSIKNTKNFGIVADYKLSSGIGARFSVETGNFIGYLGRGL